MKPQNTPEMVKATPIPSIKTTFNFYYGRTIEQSIFEKFSISSFKELFDDLKEQCHDTTTQQTKETFKVKDENGNLDKKKTLENFQNYLRKIGIKPTGKENPEDHQLSCFATGGEYFKDWVNNKNCKYVQLFVIDIDNKEGDIQEKDIQLNYKHIRYESTSSTKEKKKWRLIIPLVKPIYEHYKLNYPANVDILFPEFDIRPDPLCMHIGAKFFIPDHTKEKSFKLFNDLPLYNYQILETEPEKKPKKEKVKTEKPTSDFYDDSKAELNSNWRKVDLVTKSVEEKGVDITDGYDGWMKIAFALGELACVDDENFERGLEVFKKLSNRFEGKQSSEEKIESKFFEFVSTRTGEIGLGTLIDMARKKGCYPDAKKEEEIDSDVLYLVRSKGTQNLFHLAYKNIIQDKIIKLEEEVKVEDVVARLESDMELGKKRYELTYEHISTIKVINKKGDTKQVPYPSPKIKMDYSKTATASGYILGADSVGQYVEKTEHSLTVYKALHCSLKGTPVYNKNIDMWLRQLPFKYEWLCKYLYWVRDCKVALPALLCYDQSSSGKSFLGLLLGCLFSIPKPIDKYFENPQFTQEAGTNPIIVMSEKTQGTCEQLKDLITSSEVTINQKNQSHLTVKGYSRLFISHNNATPSLPKSFNADSEAMDRRFQIVKFLPKHKEYMLPIPRPETDSWLLEKKWLNHVEWIKQELGTLEMEEGTFGISTYATDEMKLGMSLSSSEEVSIYDFVMIAYAKAPPDKKQAKQFAINVPDLRNSLQSRYRSIAIRDDNNLAEFIRSVFGGEKHGIKLDRFGGSGASSKDKRVSIPMKIIEREFTKFNREH